MFLTGSNVSHLNILAYTISEISSLSEHNGVAMMQCTCVWEVPLVTSCNAILFAFFNSSVNIQKYFKTGYICFHPN